MKIIKYNVCLHRLDVHQLELLRYWRNNNYISQYMDYKVHITENMQKEWFNKINNINNFFFIIEFDDTPLGLINTSNINWETGVADTGLFVWEEIYINSPVPVLASLSMLDVFFTLFGLTKVTAKVKNDNVKAINYNASLGFSFVNIFKNTDFSLYELSAERYFKHANALRKSAETLYKNSTAIYLNPENKLSSVILDIINKAPEMNKQELKIYI